MEGDLLGKANDSQFISFQDYSPINRSTGAGQAQLDLGTPDHHVNFGNDPSGIGMIQDLQGMPSIKDEADEPRSFWTIEYYQKFFNINTNDVVERIKRSMVPHGNDNYLLSHIRPNPDLYGPFWVCVTLVFSIAVSGNMANFLQTPTANRLHWKYDFHLVSYAATCIFLYAWLLPLVLWGCLRWTKSSADIVEDELIESNSPPGLLELLCLYGYSLAIFVPTTLLLTVQIGWLQWVAIGLATFSSGGVLLRCLLPLLSGKQKPIYIAAILGMHILLATGCMLYFFHVPQKSQSSAVHSVNIPSATIANMIPKVTIANIVPKISAAVLGSTPAHA